MKRTKNFKRQKLRNNEYYDIQKVFDQLYLKSKLGYKFSDLMSKIISDENILLAYRNIKKNTGSMTKGTDGKTIESLKKLENHEIISLARNKLRDYKPQKVRRVEIPKPNGDKRPLGIPTISDRLVQQCILQVMEPICEAKFHNNSYGFRPLRSTNHALARAYFLAQSRVGFHYVVDVDIKGFFDNINHAKLLKQIWTLGIRDKTLMAIISKLLKAEIEGEGKAEKGTPQGGIISPLLANIVLNEFDHWISDQWQNKSTIRKYANDDSRTRSLKNTTKLKEVYLVRYADDFKLFCKDYTSAKKLFEATKMWLKERLSLDISKEKSKIVNLKTDYSEFLGFKFKVHKKRVNDKTGKPKWVVKSHICDKAKRTIEDKIKSHIVQMSKPKSGMSKQIVGEYNSYLIGVHNYYKYATNCNIDFSKIQHRTRQAFFNKLKPRKRKPSDKVSKYIADKYGKSKQLRFHENVPLIPVGYVRHEKALQYKGLSPYVEEDREQIHKNQKVVSDAIIKYMIRNPIKGRSVEYNDNRISLYIGQYGRCYISGADLDVTDMHCHHILPYYKGGTDEYKNLVLINSNIHRLLHASTEESIEKYRKLSNLDKQVQIEKVNKFRKIMGNSLIVL